MYEYFKIATLDQEGVAKINALEEKLGVHMMAFKSGVRLARLDPEAVEQVRALEKELGVLLLVYEEIK
jgi:hypothetical protein